MTAKSILFLGATGFGGGNLAQKLLVQGHRLICLARASQNTSGRERLKAVLGQFFPNSFLEELEHTRLEIVEGDITKPRLGLTERIYERLRQEVGEIWHCAALLSFDARHRPETEACNVTGTYQVLEFARTAQVNRFHYLSTAYVAGQQQGLIPEQYPCQAHGFKNPYEQTKWQAEKLVSEYELAGHVKATVYRPSIIIGDTKPGTLCPSGVYRVAQLIAAIAAKYGLKGNGREGRARMRIPGSKDCGLNLVPIDFVVNALSAIAERADAIGKVFHLVNPLTMPNGEVVAAVGDALGIKLELAEKQDFQLEPKTGPERALANIIKTYVPYLHDRLTFDERNTRKTLNGTDIVCPPITRARLASLVSYSQNAAGMSEVAETRPGKNPPVVNNAVSPASPPSSGPFSSQARGRHHV